MNRLLHASALLLLAGAVGLAVLGMQGGTGSAMPAAPVAASVEMVPDRHDFGAMARTDVPTATFEIRNTHPVLVECGAIVKGCSCSSAEVTPKVIPAGEAATLTVTWRLAGKRGPAAETLVVPYVGSGGVGGVVYAKLAATVRGVVDPDKEVIELTSTDRVGEVSFVSAMGRPFRITAAVANHGSLKAVVLPDGRRVRVEFDPAVAGWESGQLMLVAHTDQRDEPEVRVWVRVSNTTPLEGGIDSSGSAL